jgi:ankyrin repeat protein
MSDAVLSFRAAFKFAKAGKADELIDHLNKKPLDAERRDEEGANYTPLHYAAENGHNSCVKALIGFGVDVNKQNGFGGYALQLAAQNGFAEITTTLLKAGAKVDGKNSHQGTPLQLATIKGHVECVSVLLLAGADSRIRDMVTGNLPLHFASLGGHVQCLDKIIYAMKASISAGQTSSVEHTLEEIGYTNTRITIDDVNLEGKSALYLAAEHADDSESAECIQLLISAGKIGI